MGGRDQILADRSVRATRSIQDSCQRVHSTPKFFRFDGREAQHYAVFRSASEGVAAQRDDFDVTLGGSLGKFVAWLLQAVLNPAGAVIVRQIT